MSTSSFPDSFDDSHPTAESAHPFDDDNSFVGGYTPPAYSNDDVFGSNGNPTENGVFVDSSNGPILPPPSDMQEEGFALREWRRQNANLLEQKEKREKEILTKIIEEANEFKVAFHEKRKTSCETNKTNNREKEKLFLANQERFHKEVDKNYWKAIAELIPNEVPVIKKRGKKENEKKPSVVVIQGPKPGKPTDLARMRQILVKLKHNSPTHLKLAPPAETSPTKDAAAPEAAVAVC